MDNLLITIYNSGKVTEDEVKEFISWHSEIGNCSVCGKKLMHDDEAYHDSKLGGVLCDSHSTMNESTDMYEAPTADDIYRERLKLISLMNDYTEIGENEKSALVLNELQHLNIFYNKILKHEFKNKV